MTRGPIPRIGDIVQYRLTSGDVYHYETQRSVGGNTHRPGDIVPLLVVRVWPDEYRDLNPVARDVNGGELTYVALDSPVGINGQAFVDGVESIWVTSAPHGSAIGFWNWQ